MDPTARNWWVAARLAAGHRLTRHLVLGVGSLAAVALLGLSLATGMVAVEVVGPVAAVPPSGRAAPPTTTTPGQPSTVPEPTGVAVPPSGMSAPTRIAPRGTATQQPPARPTLPPAASGPGARPGRRGGPPPTSVSRPGLVRVRVRPIGACVEVLIGLPPIRTCQQGGR